MKQHFPVLQYMNVPNFITTLGLFFGIVGIYYLMQFNLRWVLVCLFLAMVMDVIDGFAAGKLKQQTRFGQQMDLLNDFFICCILPVGMVYVFVGDDVLYIGALMFYAASGLWRLAHFTLMAAEGQNSGFYTGLPVPGAVLIVCLSVWLVRYHGLPPWLSAAVLLLTGLLMASSFKLKKYGMMQKVSWVVGLAFFVVIVAS